MWLVEILCLMLFLRIHIWFTLLIKRFELFAILLSSTSITYSRAQTHKNTPSLPPYTPLTLLPLYLPSLPLSLPPSLTDSLTYRFVTQAHLQRTGLWNCTHSLTHSCLTCSATTISSPKGTYCTELNCTGTLCVLLSLVVVHYPLHWIFLTFIYPTHSSSVFLSVFPCSPLFPSPIHSSFSLPVCPSLLPSLSSTHSSSCVLLFLSALPPSLLPL